jgi:methionyl-tRNA formyltransferase
MVITRPDRPAGRGRRDTAPPVKRVALEHGLPVVQPEKVRDRAFAERLERCQPDFLVVVAYGRILPRRVLDIPRHGAINLHFSILPRYRGAAPVQWALVRGERTTGVTTIRMNERMDEGDILLGGEVTIEPDEHAPALSARLAALGAEVLLDTLRGVARGTVLPRPQDASGATLAPMLTSGDGRVAPTLTAAQIEGRIRGFDPWPGVWMARAGSRLRLVRGRAIQGPTKSTAPGSLMALHGDGLHMMCGAETILELLEVQPEGRRVMSVRDALNGRQLQLGDRLGAVVVGG